MPENTTSSSNLIEKKRTFDTFPTIVEAAQLISPLNRHMRFRLVEARTLDFKAGQFVQAFIPTENEKPRRTAYSIASWPEHNDFFELCVTRVDGGPSSSYLHNIPVGTTVNFMGPLGKFALPSTQERDLVFISTGSGIAPFRSMIHDLFYRGVKKNITLLYGNRFDNDILYKNEWDALAEEHKNFQVFYTLSRPMEWTGWKGYVQDHIQAAVPNFMEKDFYICGLNAMIKNVQDKLVSLGVPLTQIHYERYD